MLKQPIRLGGLAVSLLLCACGGSTARDQSPKTITLLQTSDLHTNVLAWDYFQGLRDEKRGLAKVATLVKQERAANACTLLIDTGDAIQGTPLGTYYALVDNAPQHPMAVTMNALGYDVMALGNHEFNYGQGVLGKFISEARFPVLAANVRKSDGSEGFQPYLIKEVCGVRVGILGLVTPGVTTWERPENINGLRFDDPITTAAAYVPRLQAAGAEVIVVAIHSGPDKQPTGKASDPASWLVDYASSTGWLDRGNLPGENEAVQLAQQVSGIDVILTGHTHQPIPKMMINGVLLTQPNVYGSHLGEVTLNASFGNGRYAVSGKDSRLLAVDSTVAEDVETQLLVKHYHDQTVSYVAKTIGSTVGPFPGGFPGRVQDSALADLINQVQEDAAHQNGYDVDLSLAALFTDTGALPQGPITLRDAYSIYIYDNTLYVLQINGSILRRALELDATYFAQLDPNHLPGDYHDVKKLGAAGVDYNWDIYSRINYTVDATQPEGSRITQLSLNGQPVTDAQPLKVAINNYRAGGGGGYAMFKEGTILWKSADGVRDFVASYVSRHAGLDPNQVNTCNFTLVPNLYKAYFAPTLGPAKCAP